MNPRGRVPSWASNPLNQPIALNKPDSQTNLHMDEQYDDELIEYGCVSNADLYIYDFDTMKEYKKYYP